ncbi:MAG: hypothetical protein HFH88_16705 [Lachnospiraceae bacterium]|nr:hypothetical protein [Lachnospiraceae bacterium]
MSKRKPYALIALFLLSFGVVIGGWFLTEELLLQRQEEFLERTGRIARHTGMPSALQPEETAPFSSNQPGEPGGDLAEGSLFEGQPLSEEMMAEVLSAWESGGNELPHEPRKGQINMEQAIDIGKEWIAVMAECGIAPEGLAECDFDKVAARLCTLDTQVSFDDSLLSCWLVQYTENDLVVSLTVHASSGKIWKASLSMKERDRASNESSYEEMLEIAFPFIERGSTQNADLENNDFCAIMPEGLVYAAVKEYQIAVKNQDPIIVIDFWLGTV